MMRWQWEENAGSRRRLSNNYKTAAEQRGEKTF